uniref:Uncharacterized protein n=1 Tax=Setaria italica TaxID=4555 RepID=K3Y487_SETIT
MTLCRSWHQAVRKHHKLKGNQVYIEPSLRSVRC